MSTLEVTNVGFGRRWTTQRRAPVQILGLKGFTLHYSSLFITIHYSILGMGVGSMKFVLEGVQLPETSQDEVQVEQFALRFKEVDLAQQWGNPSGVDLAVVMHGALKGSVDWFTLRDI